LFLPIGVARERPYQKNNGWVDDRNSDSMWIRRLAKFWILTQNGTGAFPARKSSLERSASVAL
jgi:hypothetical protein